MGGPLKGENEGLGRERFLAGGAGVAEGVMSVRHSTASKNYSR